jgi:hypothetical protein
MPPGAPTAADGDTVPGVGTVSGEVWATPFDVVRGVERPRPVSKADVLRVARALEREALAVPPDTVAASLQDVRYLTPRTRAVYSAIAVTGPRRVLFGRDLPAYIAPGVAGVALDDTDPLVDVWSVVLLSATAAVALAATDLHEPAALDTDRRFLLAVTRDRDAVSACLHTLALRRVAAPGDLADAAERLRAEFADRLPAGVVGAVLRQSAHDVSGAPAGAWPELVERAARQRLRSRLEP